jgi:hypothetical protein
VATEKSANSAPLMKTEFFHGKIIFSNLWFIDFWISNRSSLGGFEGEYVQEQLIDIRSRTKYAALQFHNH